MVSTKERLGRLGLEKVADLAEFAEEKQKQENERSKLRKKLESERGRLESARAEVGMLEKRKKTLVDENFALFLLSRIRESKKTSLPCRRCGWLISVSIGMRENYRRMIESGLALTVQCPCCGYQNWFDPREVIFNIGWMVLPT